MNNSEETPKHSDLSLSSFGNKPKTEPQPESTPETPAHADLSPENTPALLPKPMTAAEKKAAKLEALMRNPWLERFVERRRIRDEAGKNGR
jgi:hypothetical protein